ncbi:hypothetical protein ACQR0Z_13560 [Bradyrhizobium sp. HKCCYLS3077]|uniref:hypothetical protein n=1 Tax=Bradyrhizobium sp. HKCCYLS3077 TaxID=3420761 RepID=UPI003EB720A5
MTTRICSIALAVLLGLAAGTASLTSADAAQKVVTGRESATDIPDRQSAKSPVVKTTVSQRPPCTGAVRRRPCRN